jgi:ABC-type multidrug transport system ATPase subunit
MVIKLANAAKRFNRDWVFKNISLQFLPGETYAITGPNGSGKSTLLQVLAGSMAVSEGTINWIWKGKPVDEEKVHHHIAIAAPYLEVIEEMTAIEFLEFHGRFKNFLHEFSAKQVLDLVSLSHAAHKQIRYFSSGMKQRIKLAQAFFSDVPLLLLDEPCTNLDAAGIALYLRLVRQFSQGRTVIVSSNDEVEYSFCKNTISIMNFKA